MSRRSRRERDERWAESVLQKDYDRRVVPEDHLTGDEGLVASTLGYPEESQPKSQHEPGPILWGCSGVIVATALGITLVLWGIGRFL